MWPGTRDDLIGSWQWAAASPDGRTILVQWSAECEIPMAFLVAVADGRPASVTGKYTRDDPPPNSTALGWSDDGRAIVFIPAETGCGGTDESGVFLIDLAGNKTRIGRASPDARLDRHRSLRPRSLDAIKRELTAPKWP
jgi:Tol biopolymer transport system component